MDARAELPDLTAGEPYEMPVVWIAGSDDHVRHPSEQPTDEGFRMTQAFYVAVPYTMAELSEPEEQHEIGEYIDYVGYDVRGFHGEVRLDDKWHTVWAFSEADAAKFISEWGGILLDEATQKRVTGQRSREAEMLKDLEEHLGRKVSGG